MQERSGPRLTPSASDLAYLAGIIDGEGTIGIYRGGAPYSYHLALVVTNTHRPMLEWVHARIGGSLVRATRQTLRHKQGWQVVLVQARAASVIRLCRPFLIVKAPQADLGMQFIDEFVSFKGWGVHVSEQQVTRRRWYYEQSHLLNGGTGRGPRKKRA
jgi:hypothetical protein